MNDKQKLIEIALESEDYLTVKDCMKRVAQDGANYDAARTLLQIAERWHNREGAILFIDQAVLYGARSEAVEAWEKVREKARIEVGWPSFDEDPAYSWFYNHKIGQIEELIAKEKAIKEKRINKRSNDVQRKMQSRKMRKRINTMIDDIQKYVNENPL